MAVVYKGSSGIFDGGADNLPLPGDREVGDLLVVFHFPLNRQSGSPDPLPGFTMIDVGAVDYERYGVQYRVIDDPGVSEYTLPEAGFAWCALFEGATTNFTDVSFGYQSSYSTTIPAVTTTEAGSMLISFGGLFANTSSPPYANMEIDRGGGWLTPAWGDGSAPNSFGAAIDTWTQGGAGSTGDVDWRDNIGSPGYPFGCLLGIAPEGGGGGPIVYEDTVSGDNAGPYYASRPTNLDEGDLVLVSVIGGSTGPDMGVDGFYLVASDSPCWLFAKIAESSEPSQWDLLNTDYATSIVSTRIPGWTGAVACSGVSQDTTFSGSPITLSQVTTTEDNALLFVHGVIGSVDDIHIDGAEAPWSASTWDSEQQGILGKSYVAAGATGSVDIDSPGTPWFYIGYMVAIYDDVPDPPTPDPPLAHAGPDQNIETEDDPATVMMDGSGSYASAGATLVSMDWYLGVTYLGSGVFPNVSLPQGVNVVTLQVEDDYSQTDSDTVTITITEPPDPPDPAVYSVRLGWMMPI